MDEAPYREVIDSDGARVRVHSVTDAYPARTDSDTRRRGSVAVDFRLLADAARRGTDDAKATHYLYLAEMNDAAAAREERARYEQNGERER